MKNCHLSVAFMRLDATSHAKRKTPMSAGLRKRFKICHSSWRECVVWCNSYCLMKTVKMCIMLYKRWYIWKLKRQKRRKKWQASAQWPCPLYFFLNGYLQPVGCGWSISCEKEERSSSAGQSEQLQETEWTHTWHTPDPSVKLCSHACSGAGLPSWHTHPHTHKLQLAVPQTLFNDT